MLRFTCVKEKFAQPSNFSFFQPFSEHQELTTDKYAYVYGYFKILHLHFDKKVL